MTETTAQFLKNKVGGILGDYLGRPVQVLPEDKFYNTDKRFICIAETAAVVLNGMVYGRLEHDGRSPSINEVKIPYAYHKAVSPKVEVPDPVIADVAIADQIDATLRGLSLDELLADFTYGLD